MPPLENPARVLIVDDHFEMAETLAEGLVSRGFEAIALGSGKDAMVRLEQDSIAALVTDLRMQPVDGMALLAASRRLDPDRPVIVMTAFGAIDSAVESIRQGAYHYLTKPFKLDELAIFLRRALDDRQIRRETVALRKALREQFSPSSILGKSRVMRSAFDIMERVADTSVPVLITGETGTGKGLVARALHGESSRVNQPFVTINCAALPENLLESELFGHVKGAFTGAVANRLGLFADAHNGTLFLDEIGEMAIGLQAKLLHVLERGVVRPVGGSRERQVDVRVIAATHRDLRENVRLGSFREDLLYRLEVVTIELPPLRQRADDIPELVDHFMRSARARYPNSPVERLSREALERMTEYRWPGNVRELSHMIERMVLLGRSAEVSFAELPAAISGEAPSQRAPFAGEVIPIRELQRSYAVWALDQMGGSRARTAERLGIDTKTLAKWLAGENG